MAFTPSLFNVNQVDRGATPAPGAMDEVDPRTKYVRVWSPRGWVYFQVASPEGQSAIKAAPAGSPDVEMVTIPGWTDGHGYIDPNAPAVPPSRQAGPTTQTTAAPPPAAAPAPAPAPQAGPQMASSATPVEQQGGPNAQASDQAGLQGGGQWVRITPWGSGDVIGRDIVQAGSPAAQQAQAAGVRPIPLQTGLQANGVPIPDEVALSESFYAARQRLGPNAQIIAYDGAPVPGEGGNGAIPGAKITWRLPNGAEQTYTFARQDGENGRYIVRGSPETNITNVQGPTKAALEKAQAEYHAALAAKAQAELQQIPGQVESQELKNAKERVDQAERAFNTANGLGNRTYAEARQDLLTGAQTVQTQVATEGAAAQTAATLQGTKNQTYQNVLQFYRDQGNDEAKALELTMAYFNNKANVDNANNTLALNAAKAQVDAQTSSNTQRTSLANTRLNASNTGFSDDARTAMDLNQYLKPGSTLGAKALMALQGMRYANAQKYGAFAINDEDLRYDPTRLPSAITAFANPSAPSFSTYPNIDDMVNNAYNTGERMGVRGRPLPPDHNSVERPKPLPAAPTQSGAGAPPSRSGPALAPAKPAPSPAPPISQQARDQNSPQSQTSPTDVLTTTDDRGNTTTMSRSFYESLTPAQRATISVTNAQSKADYEREQVARRQSSSYGAQAGAPEENPGGRVLPQPTAAPTERPDDVLTVRDGNGYAHYYSRDQWNRFANQGDFTIENAESGNLYTYNPETDEYVLKPQNGPELPPPVEPRSDAAVSRVAPLGPTAVAQLSEPSPAATQANQLLADEEERKRRRQQELLARYNSPQAIYGLFEGSYPEPATFY